MKTSKLIFLLILVILSFSCGEEKEGNEVLPNVNAQEFMYLEYSEYVYINESTLNLFEGDTSIIVTEELQDYEGRKAIKYYYKNNSTKKEYYISSGDNCLYTYGAQFGSIYTYVVPQNYWIKSIDFSKVSYDLVDLEFKKEQIGNKQQTFKTSANMRRNIEFELKGEVYTGYSCLLIHYSYLIIYDENDEIIDEIELESREDIWIAKGLGIVKNEIVETSKSHITNEEKTEVTTITLIDIKQK